MDIKGKLGFIPLLILDDGHGMETPGKRTPKFEDGHFTHENEFNKAVISLLEADALRLGFKTLQVASGDDNVPLQTRTDKANAAYAAYKKQLGGSLINGKPIAVFISEHYNAMLDTFEGSDAEGVETFCYKFGGEGELLARVIHKYIIQGTPQKNRGVKTGNLHVLRETVMPAVLIEAGFMDDPREAALMTSAAFQLETATQILMGICEYYGLVYEPKQAAPTGTAILRKPSATMKQAQAWARRKGATEQFVKNAVVYWNLAASCGGVDPAGAYVQSAKETNYGKFGGVLDASFCNPCGMKTSQGGGNYDPNAHQRFNNWDMGIAAHLDHLALYAGAPGYPKTGSPDPRHFSTIKGKAPNWEDLGGKWAPAATYGQDIAKILAALQATPEPVTEPTDQEKAVDAALAAGIITDRAYWLKVLNGEEPVSLGNLKQAFLNAKGLKRG